MPVPANGWPRRASWRVSLAALLAQLSLLTVGQAQGNPCELQLKAVSYGLRIFAEAGSGFLAPHSRPLPYVFTPRLTLLLPLDAWSRWHLSPTVAMRFGDGNLQGVIGVLIQGSILSGASTIKPGIALGLGPELVLSEGERGFLDGVAQLTVDLTPLMFGGRVSWGPINRDFFSNPARLETYLGWRIKTLRRSSAPIERLLGPGRPRFRPYAKTSWASEFREAIAGLSATRAQDYLSLVQQMITQLDGRFKRYDPNCGRKIGELEAARIDLDDALQHPEVEPDVREQLGLENLLHEHSEAFVSSLQESLRYSLEAEAYQPSPTLLAPAVMHAMNCVLDGSLAASCLRAPP